MSQQATDPLVALRRDLHSRPEPAWCEFYTTSRIVDEIERIGVDELHVGRDVIDPDARRGVPDERTIEEWRERAREAGAREDVLDATEGGNTGAVAVYEAGDGPTVALRTDIDALPRTESDDDDHYPATEGFRSEHDGYMHACGHDAHATIGIGVLEAIVESDFDGTFKVLFQPSEERGGGAKPMTEAGVVDDVDYLLAVHVGMDHPTGEIVGGISGFLATGGLEATFLGEPAHAGGKPEDGRNAFQAMAAAIQNLYGIARHSDGGTRVNVGVVEGGTATNIIPEEARIKAEVRGDTTDLRNYMLGRAETVVEHAAGMHDCEVDLETRTGLPGAESDDELASIVTTVAENVDGVTSTLEYDDLGGSEDATYLMNRVQELGGLASYVGVGTDHPGGHHTGTFDVDEESLGIGIEVLTESLLEIAETEP